MPGLGSNLTVVIDNLIESVDDETLTHILTAATFEIARRDGTTPRRIHEIAFIVAPSDEEYLRLQDAL